MDPDVIRRKLKSLRVSPANRQMVEYWLSLSRDGDLPLREDFDPTAASELLRGCALFDVKPGKSVHCRIAGTVMKLVFGMNLAGQDWLERTAPRHRAQRLVRYSAVAQGAIGVGRRMVVTGGQPPVAAEEILLPFQDVNEDGVRPVLLHSDWRPEGNQWFGVDPTFAITLADDFHLIALD